MAKRFQPLKEFGRTTKKPKLDISISRARPNTTPHPASTSRQAALSPSPVKSSPNNFWDDDDDDVILLATQVAESQAAVKSAASSTYALNQICESEMTFSEFAPNVHASTSTQRPPEVPHQDFLSDMFNDDDDDFAMLVEVAAKNLSAKVNEEQHFKKPSVPPSSTTAATNKPATTTTFLADNEDCPTTLTQVTSLASSVPLSQSNARRQLASERQIKFLMERVDVLKKENTKLNKDLSDTKLKIESKDGEVTLLRDELRHMKQQIQGLKMEKIFSTEAAKTECKTKIAELSKRVEAKETELQLKAVECSVLKMRHADESKRFEMSMRAGDTSICFTEAVDDDVRYQVPKPQVEKKSGKSMRSLMRLHGFKIPDAQIMARSNVSELIYEQSHERGTSKKQRSLFQLELKEMQTIVAQLQLKLQQQELIDVQTFSERTIASVCKVFTEFWSYVHSLEFPKNCRIHPYHEYDLFLDLSERTRHSLHQPSELYADERALSLRRYVAALSVICRQLPPVAHALLAHQHGEYLLLQIAVDAICKLGYAREICEHFGLLQSFAALLKSLLVAYRSNFKTTNDNCRRIELLVGMLKQLVFTRPNPWIFRELSFCLLECVHLPYALSLLCVNSAAGTFVTDRVREIYRFTNDSCFLQVYSGLLEVAFPLYTPLCPKHFELLTVTCVNHVRFVYYCFANPPKFIHKILPSYDDDDDEDCDTANVPNNNSNTHNAPEFPTINNSATTVNGSYSNATANSIAAGSTTATKEKSGNITCECYTKLCLSVVTFNFQVMRQWILADKKLETSRVAEISKISVQLLHIIFCDNYLTCLFRDAEETTKHYLCLICHWWSENTELLHFNEIHMNFLEKLRNSHVMSKQQSLEDHSANISNDLAEWYRTTSDIPNNNSANDVESVLKKLQLMEAAGNPETFFEGLKGYAFNFQ